MHFAGSGFLGFGIEDLGNVVEGSALRMCGPILKQIGVREGSRRPRAQQEVMFLNTAPFG